MFDQSWRHLSENFYDAKFHGCNWDAVRRRYRPLVKHVAMKEDLYALLYLMMGELNASHLGVSGSAPAAGGGDGRPGPDLRRELPRQGPEDRRGPEARPGRPQGLNLKAGEFVTGHRRRRAGRARQPVASCSTARSARRSCLQVVDNPLDPKAKRRRRRTDQAVSRTQRLGVDVRPLGGERNAAQVAKLSKGKLGYIHIPSMDEDGLDRFVRSLYSDNFDKEAIVLDVRFNGGGFTHDQVLNYLGSREHTIFRKRDGGEGLVLRSSDRKWTSRWCC